MTEEIVQLTPFVIWSAISLIPALSICRRVGKTRWWAALMLAPGIGPIIFMFIFAYSRWTVTPTLDLAIAPPKQVQRLEPKL
jgi:hypothetical protein